MKIEYLRKIIARIQHQIHCPKCKAPFAESSIEIRKVQGQQVEFSAQCEHCKSRSQISAEIGKTKKITTPPSLAPRALSGLELPVKNLDPIQMETLKAKLKTFKGQDIKTLFE